MSLRSRFITASRRVSITSPSLKTSGCAQSREMSFRVSYFAAKPLASDQSKARQRTANCTHPVPLIQRSSCSLLSIGVVFQTRQTSARDTEHLYFVLARFGGGRSGVAHGDNDSIGNQGLEGDGHGVSLSGGDLVI